MPAPLRRAAPAAAMLAAGAVHALAFAPGPLPAWALSPVQIAALAVLAAAARDGSPSRAAFLAWSFALAHFALGLHWIYISLHTYGYLAAPLAAAAVLVLAAFLALFPALGCGLARWLCGPADGVPDAGRADGGRVGAGAGAGTAASARASAGSAGPGTEAGTGAAGSLGGACAPLAAAAVWAAAWAGAEWLRGTAFTGFPWLNAGYAQVDGPYAGWAPLLGVYGVAFWAAFAAAALAGLWRGLRAGRVRPQPAAAACAALAAGAGLAASHVSWSRPAGPPLAVRLVQGDVDQGEKFDPQHLLAGIRRHLELAASPPAPGNPAPQLILLPETIMPLFQDQMGPEVWQAWTRLAARTGATVVMGAPLQESGGARYTNSVIALRGDTPVADLLAARAPMRYDKRHLVPFGEFVPYGFRWFVDAVTIPLGDFDRGAGRQPPFEIDGQRLAPNVCYEDLFGEELLPALRPGAPGDPGASILANFSNLGWFGDSWALPQHLQIARMRALETARPMLRATNTGATAAIDGRGRVLARLPAMQPGVLDVQVQGTAGLTPYARYGNSPVLALLAACLAWAGWARRRRK